MACALLGTAARPLVANAAVDVLRPPGAVAEDEFIARCIRCQRCVTTCPTQVLEPMGIEEGIIHIKTPKLNFSSNLCTFCDECRQVCPTRAIGVVDPSAPLLGRIGVAVVQEDRCLALLESGSCGVCVDACPYEALSFDSERRPVVESTLCNGCGECVHICPANILRSFGGGTLRGIEVVTEKHFDELRGV